MITLNRERLARSLIALDSYRAADTCPECGIGTAFIHTDAEGALEVLCDTCVLFVPADDYVPPACGRPSDLPPAVRFMRNSERQVYRVVRDLPGSLPRDIVGELERRTNEDVPRSTVQHAITRLHRVGLIRRSSNGWVVCSGQEGGAR